LAQLFVIFVRVSVVADMRAMPMPPVPAGGTLVARVDFDQYAGRYEAILAAQTNFFDGDSNYFARYKIELAQKIVGCVDKVLDFGCGIGRSMPHLREIFPDADIVGCDPSAESLAIAREQNPTCRFMSTDELGPDSKFDLVLASCVFHHIPPQDRQMAIRYCYSRLNEGGHFIIFEHNPINPVTRRLVKNCPFDADAVLLSMRETVARMRNEHLNVKESSYCLFFPQPLAALRPFEKYLRWLPMGGQYFVCASNPPSDSSRAA
jgi:SAM-dependent methyltransferase